MLGIEKLDKLLRNMSPQLHDEEFVYLSLHVMEISQILIR